jgi:hypothetical protein
MDAELDLTALGPVIIISKFESGFDFSPGNERLILAAGSTLKFEDGAVLIGGSCNASERIIIGDRLLASCNGQAGFDFSFADLLTNGGFGVVNLSSGAPVCLTNSVDLFAQPFPPDEGTIVQWYDAPSGGNILDDGLVLSASLDSQTTFYAEAIFPDGMVSLREEIKRPEKQTAVWDGAIWQNTTPDENVDVLFEAALNTGGNINACNLTVNSGNVVVNPGHSLRVVNKVSVTGGTLTFENDASLLQINEATNEGSVLYKRNTTPMERFDFTYWSSPLSNQTLFDLSPETLNDKYFFFDSSIQNWVTIFNGNRVMQPGVGYIIRSPQSFTMGNLQIFNGRFNGVPNNGKIEVAVQKPFPTSFALLGNPYPSALHADTFIDQNSEVLFGNLYFWTHNTPITNLVFTADDYSVYNKLGGTSAATGGDVPDGTIASGQGFFVNLDMSGTITFNNSQRIAGSNDRFFSANNNPVRDISLSGLSTAPSAPTNETTATIPTADNIAFEKSRLWLNMTNTQGAFSQLLLGIVPQATDGIDRFWDAFYVDGGQNVIGFYSLSEEEKLTIQAKPFAENQTETLFKLGFRSSINSLFNISIHDFDGIFDQDMHIFLEDTFTGIIHNLGQSDYAFTTNKGVFDDRFILKITSSDLQDQTDLIAQNKLVSYETNGRIKLESSETPIEAVQVFDFTGVLIFSREQVNQNFVIFPTFKNKHSLLIAKVTLADGEVQTIKIGI